MADLDERPQHQLDPKDDKLLADAVARIQALFGEELQAILLSGEAASKEYRPRKSPLTLAVVLNAVSPASLRALQPLARRWRKGRIGTPLLLDPPYIESSLDVFPLEFLDLHLRHVVLFGSDPFAELALTENHLRIEIEEQLRGKMLHLWQAYAEADSKRAVRELLSSSLPGFEVVLRGMLRLKDSEAGGEGESLIVAVEKSFDVFLPVLRRLESARLTGERLPAGELDEYFDLYLDEIRSLVRLANDL